MTDMIKRIKTWMIKNKGYIGLFLITMILTVIGFIFGFEAGLSAGTASVILILFGNIYNYITAKEMIDAKELIFTFSGMILPVIIYSLILIC